MSMLPRDGLALNALEDQLLPPGTKGLPLAEPLRQGAIAAQGWNVLHADTSFPVAVLKLGALRHNLDWMRDFCARYGATLAPHGKTTMCPQLFGAQLANGAWGMTLATAAQVQVAHRFGVRRVLLANQLVARADINSILHLLRGDPDFEFYALADSLEGVARLAAAAAGMPRPLQLLVELGIAGKRAGCRSAQSALEVARAIAAAPGLALCGIEGYEGLLVSSDRAADVQAVNGFVAQLADLAVRCDAEGLFAGPAILATAGGSAYFDLVARGFAGMPGLSRRVQPILRSGCYLTGDHGMYRRLLADLDEREAAAGSGLKPALEVWSMVQSRPEPGLAILTMGKRDASYDVELPIALWSHRPGPGRPQPVPADCRIVKMNDQHAYLQLPEGHALCQELAVGDLIGCGISHPCTTFDKWPMLLGVDDDYRVCQAFNTFF